MYPWDVFLQLWAYGFVTIVVIVGVFLALREFFCWYWKINKRIKLLEKIEENTRMITKVE